MYSKFRVLLLFLFCMTLLPLLGVTVQEESILRYLYFPPVTKPVAHAPFSFPVFFTGLTAAALVIILVLFWQRKSPSRAEKKGEKSFYRFPWWGALGVLSTGCWWVLAWSRFPWFEPVQAYTFFPLWLSFIIAMNGVCCWRVGSCPLVASPRFFLLLFPVSGGFWWCYEFVNQFVGNWYYIGVDSDPVEYALHASLAFTTVLPAFYSIHYLLIHGEVAQKERDDHNDSAVSAMLSWSMVILGCGGLATISFMPEILFPLLWVSPLLLMCGMLILAGEKYVVRVTTWGNGGYLATASLTGLICGFFWEMWNYFSYAKWLYSIPYVHGFTLFEMPLLGYLGYLPFGLMCCVVCMYMENITNPESSEIYNPLQRTTP